MKVSIITPSYNQGQFIEKTILSVLNQTYPDIEYIIVDGGSTDNTMDVVNIFREQIDVTIHEKDAGQSDAINKGFKLATGELVGWLNSDDLLYPACVETIVNLAQKYPDGSIYYPARMDLIDSKGTITGQINKRIYNKEKLVNSDYSIIQQGSFYKADFVKKAGFLDKHIHYCMDLDLWLKLLDYGDIYFCDNAPLSAFRIWEEAKTSTGGAKFLKDIRRVLRKHNMRAFSANNRRLSYYLLKALIKPLLGKKITNNA